VRTRVISRAKSFFAVFSRGTSVPSAFSPLTPFFPFGTTGCSSSPVLCSSHQLNASSPLSWGASPDGAQRPPRVSVVRVFPRTDVLRGKRRPGFPPRTRLRPSSPKFQYFIFFLPMSSWGGVERNRPENPLRAEKWCRLISAPLAT